MSNLKALRSEPMNMARLSLGDVGGGKVVRSFRRGSEYVKVGTLMSADEIASLTPANRMALVGRFIAVWPKPSVGADSPLPVAGVGVGLAERHVVALGFGRYTVIEGSVITPKAVSREEAYSLAGKPLPSAKAN